MKTVDLYFYEGENGGAIQSPIKIAGANYTPMYRLVADTGKMLTDGTNQCDVIDIQISDLNKWYEIDKPVEGDITG